MGDKLSATVALGEGMAFQATATSGHTVTLDSSADVGGRNLGFRPMELLLIGLGGCTGMDVISILRRMHQQVTGYSVVVGGDTATEHPKVYTGITVEHVVRGRRLAEGSVRRAIGLSATKYCPSSAMLNMAARVTHRYRIVDVDTDSEIVGSLP